MASIQHTADIQLTLLAESTALSAGSSSVSADALTYLFSTGASICTSNIEATIQFVRYASATTQGQSLGTAISKRLYSTIAVCSANSTVAAKSGLIANTVSSSIIVAISKFGAKGTITANSIAEAAASSDATVAATILVTPGVVIAKGMSGSVGTSTSMSDITGTTANLFATVAESSGLSNIVAYVGVTGGSIANSTIIAATSTKTTSYFTSSSTTSVIAVSAAKVKLIGNSSSYAIANGNIQSLAVTLAIASTDTKLSAYGTQGYRITGNSQSNGTATAAIISARSAIAAVTSNCAVQGNIKTLSKSVGSILYDIEYINVNIMVSSIGSSMIGTCRGSSLAEARKISNKELFLRDITARRGLINISNNFMTPRLLEIDGAEVIEPTAFEPDPNTYRQKYYYNAINNTLYMRIITRQEPGVRVAYWKKVGQ